MTKLEEKLIELGYELICVNYLDDKIDKKFYIKQFVFCKIKVEYFYDVNKYYIYIETNFEKFRKQNVIDNLQQAFNVMQKDLEELKKYENNTREK